MKSFNSSSEAFWRLILGEDDFNKNDILGQVKSPLVGSKLDPSMSLAGLQQVGHRRSETIIKLSQIEMCPHGQLSESVAGFFDYPTPLFQTPNRYEIFGYGCAEASLIGATRTPLGLAGLFRTKVQARSISSRF